MARWRAEGVGPKYFRRGQWKVFYRKSDLQAYLDGTRTTFVSWLLLDTGAAQFPELSAMAAEQLPDMSVFGLACRIESEGTMELAGQFDIAIEVWSNRT